MTLPRSLAAGVAAFGLAVAIATSAAPVDTLREFVRDVKSGHARFTQSVTSPDGAKKKASSGSFDFARPNRFRFAICASGITLRKVRAARRASTV